MNCTHCGAPGAETLTLSEPGMQAYGDAITLCEGCIAQFEVTEEEFFGPRLVEFVVRQIGPYGCVRPDPKTAEALVMALVSRAGKIVGTLADSPQAAGDMLEAASARLFEQAGWASKHSPFRLATKRKGAA